VVLEAQPHGTLVPRLPGTPSLAGGLLGHTGCWRGGGASRHVPLLLAL